jgi:hypothetical protein
MDTPLASRFPEVARWIEAAPPLGSVVWSRGPHPTLVVDGVQLASRHDPRAEAELQARLVPGEAERAALYGFAQGEIVAVLLARAALRRLRVVVLNPSVAREVLARCPAPWLADKRIELARPRDCHDLEPPFAASPADLRLADEEGVRLRDLVALELATPLLRAHRAARAETLLARVAHNEQRFAQDRDVGELFGSRSGACLCVAGAGPTLALHLDELRARAAELVAVDAALKPLLEAGVVPAFVVTQDPHEEGMRRVFAVPTDGLGRACLVYFPEVPTEVLAGWPGERLAARGGGELYRRAPERRGVATLYSSGSVLHPAVDLAVRLGARRVELFGADFALVGGASHAPGCAWQQRWELGPGSAWVLDGHGRRVPSLPNLVGYLRDLERYIAAHGEVEFVTRSRSGAAIRGARAEERCDVARG